MQCLYGLSDISMADARDSISKHSGLDIPREYVYILNTKDKNGNAIFAIVLQVHYNMFLKAYK